MNRSDFVVEKEMMLNLFEKNQTRQAWRGKLCKGTGIFVIKDLNAPLKIKDIYYQECLRRANGAIGTCKAFKWIPNTVLAFDKINKPSCTCLTHINIGPLYNKTHEYLNIVEEKNIAYIGISDFLLKQLKDVVNISLPEIGDRISQGEIFGEIESIDFVKELISPASGRVVAVNEENTKNLENFTYPLVAPWLIKIELHNYFPFNLLDSEQYEKKFENKIYNITVMASGEGTTFENLARLANKELVNFRINALITNNSKAGCVNKAIDYEIMSIVIKDSNEVWELLPTNTDLVVLAGWLKLLNVPPQWENKVLNIHPSLLPKYGGKGFYGLNVHEAVIRCGEKETGCTVHIVNNEYDSGKIIAQEKISVSKEDTPERLQKRVKNLETIIYPKTIESYLKNYC